MRDLFFAMIAVVAILTMTCFLVSSDIAENAHAQVQQMEKQ